MTTPIQAVLFDMDGVLANVGSSYRAAIIETAYRFGVNITHEQIAVEKKRGNANNDWILTKRLIEDNTTNKDFEITLEGVTEVFEEIYQGTPSAPGLCETENLIPSKGFLTEIFRRCNGKTAVVTGRPRKDCDTFLQRHGLSHLFPVCICMEDALPKPDPTPVLLACEGLGVHPSVCIMIGDTPDDVVAGQLAGAVPWGVLTPEEDAKLTLGVIDVSHSMTQSLLSSGARGVMKPGMGEMLDLIACPDNASTRFTSSPSQELKVRAVCDYYVYRAVSVLAIP
jgi:HAD superfamily hydrolase (TIGR01548 family)